MTLFKRSISSMLIAALSAVGPISAAEHAIPVRGHSSNLQLQQNDSLISRSIVEQMVLGNLVDKSRIIDVSEEEFSYISKINSLKVAEFGTLEMICTLSFCALIAWCVYKPSECGGGAKDNGKSK